MSQEEAHYKLMRLIDANAELSQRDLAKELGISVGKVNYCLRALIDKGFVKLSNFRNSEKKLAYAYVLTPSGIKEKSRVTVRFLKRKLEEYETLKQELAQLQQEVEDE